MPNLWRFFGALPEYVFSYDKDGVLVNLYTSSTVDHTLADGRRVTLIVETDYPKSGNIKVRFDGERPVSFNLRLRIPGWCKSATAQWPGQEEKPVQSEGYLSVSRKWEKGDTLDLKLDMPVRMILPNPNIPTHAGQVVFGRGPLLFCLEKEDVDFQVGKASINIRPEDVQNSVAVKWHPDLLEGIHMLSMPGKVDGKAVELKLVPWQVRANRSENSRWMLYIPNSGLPK